MSNTFVFHCHSTGNWHYTARKAQSLRRKNAASNSSIRTTYCRSTLSYNEANLTSQPAIEQLKAKLEREYNQQELINNSLENHDIDNGGLPTGLMHVNLKPSVINCKTSWEISYQQHLTKFRGSDPFKRPVLPKLVFTAILHTLLDTANQNLHRNLDAETGLEELI